MGLVPSHPNRRSWPDLGVLGEPVQPSSDALTSKRAWLAGVTRIEVTRIDAGPPLRALRRGRAWPDRPAGPLHPGPTADAEARTDRRV